MHIHLSGGPGRRDGQKCVRGPPIFEKEGLVPHILKAPAQSSEVSIRLLQYWGTPPPSPVLDSYCPSGTWGTGEKQSSRLLTVFGKARNLPS